MNNNCNNYVIAIDGPAATGKTTLAKSVAKRLNILYIDTGAMYRAVALYFIKSGYDFKEEDIVAHIDEVKIDLKYDNGDLFVILNGEDVSEQIRENMVSMAASNISKIKIVREKLVDMQRKMAKGKSAVLEGRDIGTVVFKDAKLKLFLSASEDIRAKRRKNDLDKKGENFPLDKIKEELKNRDFQDSTRKESPLKKADDAIELDTTFGTVEELTEKIIDLLNEKLKEM